MGTFIPNTREEQKSMLAEIGYSNLEELFKDIPSECIFKGELNIPKGKSELEVVREIEKIADKNKLYKKIFRGAGAYYHYIPAIVDTVSNKEEFLTSYTPYQAEISQGILQSIFEYQTMMCELTGMETSNASVYDGCSAAAEACTMCRERKRAKIYISETVDPRTVKTICTYNFGSGAETIMIPKVNGETDINKLKEMLDDESACLVIQQPNYFGVLEDVDKISTIVHEAGAKLIMSCNPISLGLLKTPEEYGVDIAVGDGQPLGLGLAYGGPYLGFMTTTKKMFRKLPGRIVGETFDKKGERGFVLTLQAREQHIRREKASSNICSNQALCALKVAVYLAAVGQKGINEVAVQCTSKAHYLQKGLGEVGLKLEYDKPFFHEFVTTSSDSNKLLKALDKKGILGGLPLEDNRILWCTTEMATKEDMDELIAVAKEVN
ncbi:MAG: aminomethyl-transferring glycine dehydrogenase subunit GcvPA [Peptostreptococcaceae bacterium]|nr:aminomethyl-transferring glycine dehydrogenase subunit GcvPA [Peptostreptococcaceae bacterium]